MANGHAACAAQAGRSGGKRLCFSVTLADCRVDTFTCGGKGGSGKDTSNNGVRIVHPPSGASGEARDSRNQLQNKRAALRRLAESPAFQAWARTEARRLSGVSSIEAVVETMMDPRYIKVEVKDADGKWIDEKTEKPRQI